MHKIIIFASLIAVASAGISAIQQKNIDLFKYSPTDIFTLPEDVDDDVNDKPPTLFNGDLMKAKTNVLQNVNSGNKFKLQVKTQNGIEVEQVGKLKDSKTFVVSGSYSFTGADGKRYKTRYTADEFGYHPSTELDLEIPEAIPSAPIKQNPFKFLNQNLNQNFFASQKQTVVPSASSAVVAPYSYAAINHDLLPPALPTLGGPLRGSGQSGDDYSYQGENNQDLSQSDNLFGQDNVDHKANGYHYNVPSFKTFA